MALGRGVMKKRDELHSRREVQNVAEVRLNLTYRMAVRTARSASPRLFLLDALLEGTIPCLLDVLRGGLID